MLSNTVVGLLDLAYETDKTVGIKKMSGYQIEGKRATYFVEYYPKEEDNALRVWNAKNGHFICLVDKKPCSDIEGLITRMFVLRNDSAHASQISTI